MEEKFKPQKNKIYPEMYVDNFRELLDRATAKFSNRNPCFFSPYPNTTISTIMAIIQRKVTNIQSIQLFICFPPFCLCHHDSMVSVQ